MISQNGARVAECRDQAALVKGTRVRIIAAHAHRAPAAETPRWAMRFGAGLRRAVAALAALVGIA
jgi:hypothetical protein